MSHKLHAIDPAERAQMMRLKSEQAQADSDANKKVEWLYSGDKIDKDAYLLGKPIDKLIVERAAAAESEKPKDGVNPFAVVDLQSKIREDPLFEIKKREIEAKRRLLENPLRMKQLQETILRTASRQESSSDEEDQRDRRRRQSDDKSDRRRRSRSSEEEERSSSRRRHKKKEKRRSRSRSEDGSKKKQQWSSTGASKTYGLDDRRRDRSPHQPRPSRDEEPKSKTRAEIDEYKARIDKLKQLNKSGSGDNSRRGPAAATAGRMSEAERERKLREMQENARWRDDVRSKNVREYKSEATRDDAEQAASKTSDSKAEASTFFNSMMRDAYVSAEDRIKRNVRNIQRNESAFDRNFARK